MDVPRQSLQTTQDLSDGSFSFTDQATPLAWSSTPPLTDSPPVVDESAYNTIAQPTSSVEESSYLSAVPSGTTSPPPQHSAQHEACHDHGGPLPLVYRPADCATAETAPLSYFDQFAEVAVGHRSQQPVSPTEAFYIPVIPSQTTLPDQVNDPIQFPLQSPTLSSQYGEIQFPMIDQGPSLASSPTGSFPMLPSAIDAVGHNAIGLPAQCPETALENSAFPSDAIPQYLTNAAQYPTQGLDVERFPQVDRASGSAAASVGPAVDAHAGAGSSDCHQVQQHAWQCSEYPQPYNNPAISPLANLPLQSPTEIIPRYPDAPGAQYPIHAPMNPPTDTQDNAGIIPPDLVAPSLEYTSIPQPYPFTDMTNYPHLHPQPAAPSYIPPNAFFTPPGSHQQISMETAGHIHADHTTSLTGPIRHSSTRSHVHGIGPYQHARAVHAAQKAAVNQTDEQTGEVSTEVSSEGSAEVASEESAEAASEEYAEAANEESAEAASEESAEARLPLSAEGIPVQNYTTEKVPCGWNGCQTLIGILRKDWSAHFLEARHFEGATHGNRVHCQLADCRATTRTSNATKHVMLTHYKKSYSCPECGKWLLGGKTNVRRHMNGSHRDVPMNLMRILVDWKPV